MEIKLPQEYIRIHAPTITQCFFFTAISATRDWLKALICQMYALSLSIHPIKPIDLLRVSSHIVSQGLHNKGKLFQIAKENCCKPQKQRPKERLVNAKFPTY